VEKFNGTVKLSDLRKHCNTTKTAVGGTFARAVERLVKEGSVRETNNNGVMGLEVVLRQAEAVLTTFATPPIEHCPEDEIPWGATMAQIPPDPVEIDAWVALGAEKWKVPMPANCFADYPFFNGENRYDDKEFWVGQPEEGRWGSRDYLTTPVLEVS
jgi:hypothetical protein